MKRKEQAEVTKNKIVDGVIRLSRLMPFSEIQIRDICAEAKVSVGNFYHHFSSKQEVVGEILYEYCKRMSSKKNTIQNKASKERILEILQFFSQSLEELGSVIVLEVFSLNIVNKNNFMLSPDLFLYQEIYHTLEVLREENRLKVCESVEEICEEIIVVFRGFFYQWCLSGGGYNLSEEIAKKMGRYLDLFLAQEV